MAVITAKYVTIVSFKLFIPLQALKFSERHTTDPQGVFEYLFFQGNRSRGYKLVISQANRFIDAPDGG